MILKDIGDGIFSLWRSVKKINVSFIIIDFFIKSKFIPIQNGFENLGLSDASFTNHDCIIYELMVSNGRIPCGRYDSTNVH